MATTNKTVSPGVFTNENESTESLPVKPFKKLGEALKSFIKTPNQGSTEVSKFDFTPNQGSIELKNKNTIFNQGGVELKQKDTLPNQGSTEVSKFDFTPNQGGVELKQKDIIPNQGSIELKQKDIIPNQGGVELKQKDTIPNQGGVELKQKDSTPNQGSIQLKGKNTIFNQGGVELKQKDTIPNQGSIDLKLINNRQSFILPLVRSDFPDQMSLKNRLEQRFLGTTKNLPQFFLSDIYTNYIKIIPFGIFNHTSTIVVQSFDTFEHTSNTVVSPFGIFTHTSTIAPIPFGIFNHTSNVLLTLPLQDVSGLQGMIIPANGGPPISSFIVLNIPTPLIQSPFPQIEVFDFTPSQGSIIINSFDFTPTQGSTEVSEFDFTPTQGGTEVSEFDFTPTQGGTTVTNFIFFPTQYDESNKVELFTFQPTRETIQIKTARYTADRLLATVTPKIKHGSATQPYNEENVYQSSKRDGVREGAGIIFSDRKEALQAQQDILLTEVGEGEVVKTDVMDNYLTTSNSKIRGEKNPFQNSTKDGSEEDPGIKYTTVNLDQQKALRDVLLKGQIVEGSKIDTVTEFLSSKDGFVATSLNNKFRLLNLKEIKELRDGVDSGDSFKDFRELIGPDSDTTNPRRFKVKFIDGLEPTQHILAFGNVDDRDNWEVTGKKDLIDFKIASLVSDRNVQFTAYLTQFNHAINSSWTDINYVGRQDTLKAFKGVTQTAGIAFLAVAKTKEDITNMYAKLTTLARITSFAKATNTYLESPACKITVGKWFVDTPCVIDSLKYDIEAGEYPWDIDGDVQMPHFVKVSFNVFLLGDNAGNQLNNTPQIFNYVK